MSLHRVLLSCACLSLGLLSACALRPHYKDMVQQEGAAPAAEGQVLMIRVVDPTTGQPIPGAKVVAGAGRERLAATSDAQGRISVPMSQALLQENPLVEVVLPKGVSRYQFQISRPAEAPAQAPAQAPAEAPATPAEAPAAPADAPASPSGSPAAPGSTEPTGSTPSETATPPKPTGGTQAAN